MFYSARHKRLGQDRHAGKHSHANRRHSWTSQRKNRAETDPAEMPADPARGHVSLSCPRRSRRPATSRHGGRSDGPGFLAVAHVPEHPLVTARGAEVAVHPVTLGRSEAGT